MQTFEVHNKHHFKFSALPPDKINLCLLIDSNTIQCSRFNEKNELLDICSAQFIHSNNTSEFINETLAFFLKDFDILGKNYNKITVQLMNRYFTLLPKSFNTENIKELLKFNLGLNDISYSSYNIINNDVCFAYAADNNLIRLIEKLFITAKINHVGALSLDLFIKQTQFKNTQVFVCIHTNLLEIIIKENQTLKFYNIFSWSANEDVLYFLLFSMEQFEINSMKANVVIAGNIKADDDLIKLLKKQIKNLNFANSGVLTKPIENLPHHYFFHILNRQLCEL